MAKKGNQLVEKVFADQTEIEQAIERFESRKRDVESLRGCRYDDPNVGRVAREIADTFKDVFGLLSEEYYRHQHLRIRDDSQANVRDGPREFQAALIRGIDKRVALLDSVINRLRDKSKYFKPPSKDTPVETARASSNVHVHGGNFNLAGRDIVTNVTVIDLLNLMIEQVERSDMAQPAKDGLLQKLKGLAGDVGLKEIFTGVTIAAISKMAGL